MSHSSPAIRAANGVYGIVVDRARNVVERWRRPLHGSSGTTSQLQTQLCTQLNFALGSMRFENTRFSGRDSRASCATSEQLSQLGSSLSTNGMSTQGAAAAVQGLSSSLHSRCSRLRPGMMNNVVLPTSAQEVSELANYI